MEINRDKRMRSGRSVVEGIEIKYDIEQETGKPVTRITASIMFGGDRIGAVTAESDGRVYMSFDYANTISYAVKKQVLTTILIDAESIFNESVENTIVATE